MQVEVEELEGLARRLKVVLPAEKLRQAYDDRMKEVAKRVNIPGFRRNTPMSILMPVLEKRFGVTVLREVASELMQSGFQQAVADNKLKVAGSTEVKPGEIDKGKDLEFEVFFETFPEVKLVDLSQTEIEQLIAEVNDDDIEKMLEKLRRQQAHWHKVDRPAAEHDRVVIDFDGFIEGKPFPGGSGKEFTLELGSRQMIPGFEEGIIGANTDEERSIDVVFPKDYPAAHLVNQKAVFKIKVREVREAHLPELDDDFVNKVGVKGGLPELRSKLREDMETELKNRLNARIKEQVLDRLIELNPLTPPNSMVEDEIKNLQEVTRQQISAQHGKKGKQAKDIELPKEPFIPQARRRVILGLLVSEAVKNFGIKLDKTKVRDKINEMVAASGYHNPEEMAAWYQQNKRLMSEIETLVLEDKVVEKLLAQAKVVEKRVSYQEAFAVTQQQG